jgi:rfaE bifunctional protein kinase chain/domain/rfaE bifunctional protein nucleotidyltransferase chain/domain
VEEGSPSFGGPEKKRVSMRLKVVGKLCPLERLEALGRRYRARGKTVVHCHGCFDIVHPGHLRYLQFASMQGDVLLVSLTGDDAIEKSDGTRPYMPQELRAEALAALEFVDHVVISETPDASPIISRLRPDLYVKGKDYEHSAHPGFLAEKELVEALGGRVMFSSGDVVYSSTAIVDEMEGLLEREGFGPASSARLAACCERWGLSAPSARELVERGFGGLRVAIVGDIICDEYVFCDAGGVASEAPILAVRTVEERHYLGGAGVVAAHVKALGAEAVLVSAMGRDAASAEMAARLDELQIATRTWTTRASLPVKRRYLVDTQKVLKVDRAAPQPLDSTTETEVLRALEELRPDLDAVIFCDFGFGTIGQRLLSRALPALRRSVPVIAGDISRPQRSLLAMKGVDLLAPNELELRSVMGDFESSLPGVAFRLMKQLRVANLAVTMGSRGCVLFRPREPRREEWFTSRLRSDYVPSLSSHAVDPVGAGDAFLAAATLSLCAGGTLNQAGYLGSAAAAIAVEQIGNHPIGRDALVSWLRCRPELRARKRTAVSRG